MQCSVGLQCRHAETGTYTVPLAARSGVSAQWTCSTDASNHTPLGGYHRHPTAAVSTVSVRCKMHQSWVRSALHRAWENPVPLPLSLRLGCSTAQQHANVSQRRVCSAQHSLGKPCCYTPAPTLLHLSTSQQHAGKSQRRVRSALHRAWENPVPVPLSPRLSCQRASNMLVCLRDTSAELSTGPGKISFLYPCPYPAPLANVPATCWQVSETGLIRPLPAELLL